MRERKPAWVRAPVVMGRGYRSLGRTMRDLDLVTVCEEAGCPNIYECWSEGTATFMINGDRCTRACGFCLVDTRRPLPVDPGEPERVAEAVSTMGLAHAVVTAVARDDVADGGASGFAAAVRAIRDRCPGYLGRVAHPRLQGGRRGPRASSSGRDPRFSTTTSRPWRACSERSDRQPGTHGASRCSLSRTRQVSSPNRV